MANKTTRKRGLSKPDGAGKVPTELGRRIRADRRARKMTWEVYAKFMGMQLATIYKIASGATQRPNELTVDHIEAKLKLAVNTAEGAADAVVSSGQRHPERSED